MQGSRKDTLRRDLGNMSLILILSQLSLPQAIYDVNASLKKYCYAITIHILVFVDEEKTLRFTSTRETEQGKL